MEVNITKYAKLSKCDVDTVREAFEEAIETFGDGYTEDYYWSAMASSLCNFYRSGYENGRRSKENYK